MSTPLVVFKAINKASDQQELFQKVLAGQESLFLRDKDDREMRLTPMSLNSNLQFKCHCSNEFLTEKDANFLMSFVVNKEKYLCDVTARLANEVATVSVKNLFHMQKRRNYRYTLPEGYGANLKVTAVNQAARGFIGRLIDLSTEGCAIEISQDTTDILVKQTLTAEVQLSKKRPIAVEGIIKNIRPIGITHFILGIEFNHMAKASEMNIVTALTEIQRDVYLKKAG